MATSLLQKFDLPDHIGMVTVTHLNKTILIAYHLKNTMIRALYKTICDGFCINTIENNTYIGIPSKNIFISIPTNELVSKYGLNRIDNLTITHSKKIEPRTTKQSVILEESLDSYTIQIKTLTDMPFNLKVTASTTIGTVKFLIYNRKGIHPDQQRLIFSGIQMEDDRTLQDYRVQRESVFYLVLKLRGGMYDVSSGRDGAYEALGMQIRFISLDDADIEFIKKSLTI
jgi:ubiquitin-large subunit ribosomal protein L40e